MISTYQKIISNKNFFLAVLFAMFFAYVPHSAFAAPSTQTLSITPTLFQIVASPGQSWSSSLKVINSNRTPITVYAQVVNFAPEGETGQGKFLPILDESTATATLAGWIDISHDGVSIDPEQSYSIPFTVHIPQDVTPGGHFAAILIGTKPPKKDGVSQIGTSQIVTSLFFLKIAGDVIENGDIREFTVSHAITDVPKAQFEVRFENKGNVLLQPQGDITITNMWGKERGVIPINHETHFGNVLPKSIRKFEFSWEGEPSFSDIGRYKATITLAYGEENRQFVTSIVYFYVIPLKAGLIVLASLLAFGLFITWAIKAYIRRMLAIAGFDPHAVAGLRSQSHSYVKEGDVLIERRVSVRAPVEHGVLDLKKQLQRSRSFKDKAISLFAFIKQYRLFFGGVVFVLIAVTAASMFIVQATKAHRNYQVTISNAGADVKLSSEDIIYKEQTQNAAAQEARSTEKKEQAFDLILVNSSDTPGAAASLQQQLESKGYTINHLESDLGKAKDHTVLVYSTAVQNDALALSKLLGNALLSASPEMNATTSVITIYIGNDYKKP